MRLSLCVAFCLLWPMTNNADDHNQSVSEASATLMNCLKTGLHYPAISRRDGQEGKLLIQFNVDEQGQIHQETLKTATTFPALNAAAMQHFQRCAQHKTELPQGNYVVPIVFQIEE